MKAVRYMEEQEVMKRGVEILFKELGPTEASRFMNLSTQGMRLESVKRHRAWQTKLDKDVFFDDIFNKE
ncbi:MAG: hypothetical protein ACOYOS_25140 [Syntrophales bacterium]